MSELDGEDVLQYAEKRCESSCSTLGPGLLIGMLQANPKGEPQFLHRTNGEYSLTNNEQISSEFVLAPRNPILMGELLWQIPYPSQGWAFCMLDAIPLEVPGCVESSEHAALESLSELLDVIMAGNLEGYLSMEQGERSEIVRSAEFSSSRRSNTTSNTTSSPTSTPTGAPTAAPTASSWTIIQQDVTFSSLEVSTYTGDLKVALRILLPHVFADAWNEFVFLQDVYDVGYALALGVEYNTSSLSYNDGTELMSEASASSARRSGTTVLQSMRCFG